MENPCYLLTLLQESKKKKKTKTFSFVYTKNTVVQYYEYYYVSTQLSFCPIYFFKIN